MTEKNSGLPLRVRTELKLGRLVEEPLAALALAVVRDRLGTHDANRGTLQINAYFRWFAMTGGIWGVLSMREHYKSASGARILKTVHFLLPLNLFMDGF